MQVLSDDEKRSIYDRYGEAGLKGAGMGGSGVSSICQKTVTPTFFLVSIFFKYATWHISIGSHRISAVRLISSSHYLIWEVWAWEGEAHVTWLQKVKTRVIIWS